jgi:hypothetical protein
MQVRIRETGAVMYEGEFRALHPSTSFPQQISAETLDEFGADVVFEGPQTTGGDVYQYSQAAGVELVNGKWFTKYILGPVFTDGETTAAEQEAAYKASKDADQAKSVRTSRNDKLKECDWTQVADAPVDQTVWAAYRQALRDISSQDGFPWTITWPTQPE